MYGVNSYPTKILIGKNGKIIKRFKGTGQTAGAKKPKIEAPKSSGASAAAATSSVSKSAGSSATAFKNMKTLPKGLSLTPPGGMKKEPETNKSRLEILLEKIFNK